MHKIAMTAGAIAVATAAMAEPADFKSADGRYTIEAIEALGRVSAPTVTPDGKTLLFGISYENLAENNSNNDLYTLDLNAKNAVPVRITDTPKSEGSAVWIEGGKRIAFLYPDADGNSQLWTMNADGTGREQASTHPGGISGFLFAPDGKQIVVIGNVKYARTAGDIYPDLPKATGRVIDDLMYKH